MTRMTRFPERASPDVVNIVAGLALALAPWAFGFIGTAVAAWNAWLVGAAIALVALWATVSFRREEEWVNGGLGIWATISPWALGFSELEAATTAHVVLGLLVALVAAARLWTDRQRPRSAG